MLFIQVSESDFYLKRIVSTVLKRVGCNSDYAGYFEKTKQARLRSTVNT